jgi:DNA-binding SARP family transcriptional activator
MASLRSSLWRLHSSGHHVVEAVGQQLQLNESVSVDVRETRSFAKVAQRHDVSLTSLDQDSIDEFIDSGDLLPDWYDDWVFFERESLRQLRLHALESLCRRLAVAGRFQLAVQAGVAAVRAEPLRETAHEVLMSAHLREGNRAEAIRHFRTYTELIRAELDVEPALSLEALTREVSGDASVTRNGIKSDR